MTPGTPFGDPRVRRGGWGSIPERGGFEREERKWI